MAEVAELLEGGHLVADRRRGDSEGGALGDRLGAHRLPRAHVLLDEHAENHRLAVAQIGIGHEHMIRSTPGREC